VIVVHSNINKKKFKIIVPKLITMICWALSKGSEPKREYKLLMLPLNEEVFFFFFITHL